MDNSFNLNYTIECLTKICFEIDNHKEVPLKEFCQFLNQFCYVFQEVNSFLGIAFNDVKLKSEIINANWEKFPGHPGLISFIKMEMEQKIHLYNSKNGKQNKGAPPEFKTYSSTARNLLRMMWLMTFLKVTFTRIKEFPKEDLSTTFNTAYDSAFGQSHSWILQKSAKVAIYATASKDKSKLYQAFLKKKATQEELLQQNNRFLNVLLPVHDFLWAFYKENKIDKLP